MINRNNYEAESKFYYDIYGLPCLAKKLANYGPAEYEEINMTKEELQAKYNRLKFVLETITTKELQTIWYLRNSRRGEISRFYNAAKDNYETYMTVLMLNAVSDE